MEIAAQDEEDICKLAMTFMSDVTKALRAQCQASLQADAHFQATPCMFEPLNIPMNWKAILLWRK